MEEDEQSGGSSWSLFEFVSFNADSSGCDIDIQEGLGVELPKLTIRANAPLALVIKLLTSCITLSLYEEACCKQYLHFAKHLIVDLHAAKSNHSVKFDPSKFSSTTVSATDLELVFAGPVSHTKTANSYPVMHVCQAFDTYSHNFALWVNGDKLVSVSGSGTDMCPIAAWLLPQDKIPSMIVCYKKIKIEPPETLSEYIVDPDGGSDKFIRFLAPVLKLSDDSKGLTSAGSRVQLSRPALVKAKRASRGGAVPQDIQDLVGAAVFLSAAKAADPADASPKKEKSASKDAKHLLR
jgi:hypothetical protein